MRSLELFTGCGGLALGLSEAGFSHALLVERDKGAHATVEWNKSQGVKHVADWPVRLGDVSDIDYSAMRDDVDVVAGGPPCQPFSIGGNHRGPEDERNMWPEAVRAVREVRPKAFLFENVRGLLRPAFDDYLAYLRSALAWPAVAPPPGGCWRAHMAVLAEVSGISREYRVVLAAINAADYGAPQTRHRAMMIGVRQGLCLDPGFPPPTHSRAALIWDQHVTGEYWRRHGIRPMAPASPAEARAVQALKEGGKKPSELPWVTVRDVLEGLPSPTVEAEPVPGHRLHPGARVYARHTGSRWDAPAKAVKAGAHGVPGGENILLDEQGPRYFTIREMLRLQGFPDGFGIPGGGWRNPVKQLGNAVPVQVGRAFGQAIARMIEQLPGTAVEPRIDPGTDRMRAAA